MKLTQQWLSANGVARELISGRSLIVRGKMIGDVAAYLEAESVNHDGKIVVSANYNSNPFPGTQALAKAYLTQEDYEDFLSKGPRCVLELPK